MLKDFFNSDNEWRPKVRFFFFHTSFTWYYYFWIFVL